MRKRIMITRAIWTAMGILLLNPLLSAQEEREYIRKGNRLYKKSEFAGSEGMYRRAHDQEGSTEDAVFNLGNALYKQGRFGEAADEFIRSAAAGETDTVRQAQSLYNLGNSLVKEQKYEEGIRAYINSLKLDPGNLEAKYNLAWAQDQLQQQQQQQDQGQNNDENQEDNNDNQQQQGQNDEQQQDQENQSRDQEQQQEQSMSREDAKRLLDALAANEKETREKVQREKAAGARVRVIKNW